MSESPEQPEVDQQRAAADLESAVDRLADRADLSSDARGRVSSVADSLTDDMGRPIPELVLPFVVVGGVLALVWVWRRSSQDDR